MPGLCKARIVSSNGRVQLYEAADWKDLTDQLTKAQYNATEHILKLQAENKKLRESLARKNSFLKRTI